MYVIAPNVAEYYLTPRMETPLDIGGGHSMIVDYQGRVISNHEAGGSASYAGAIVDIEALRQYRARSLWGNWLKDLRTEQYRLIYDRPIYEKNRCLTRPPLKHAENDRVVRAAVELMLERDIWKRPAYMLEKVEPDTRSKARETAGTEAD